MQVVHCIVKCLHDFKTVGVTRIGFAPQHLVNDIYDGARYICTNSIEWCWVTLETRNCSCLIVLFVERDFPRKTFVQHNAERIDVCALIKFATLYLFWRKVLDGAHHDVGTCEIGSIFFCTA